MATVSSGITPDDRKDIEEILRSSGFFYEFEIQTALEIANETLAKGAEKAVITGSRLLMRMASRLCKLWEECILNTFMGPLLDSRSPEFKEQEAWYPAPAGS
jgi:tellurite resistance protein